MDIVITNAWLMTFKGENLGLIKNGAIGVKENKIVFVGKTADCDYKSADKIIDGKNHLVMPGLVNAHIHTSLNLLRGGAQDVPEIEWMNKALGPLARHLQADDLVLGSKIALLEAIRTGTTTFAEYTRDVDRLIMDVYKKFNARVVATETINEVSANRAHLGPRDLYEFDRAKGNKEFDRAKQLQQKYENDDLVTTMFGPQALDMISLELLEAVFEEAKKQQTGVHMHIAQGGRERLQIQERYGKDASTVKVLKNNNLLSNQLIGAHCHDTTSNERKILAEKGMKMVGCPSSISMIDGIVPPVEEFISLKTTVGLGTDQAPGVGQHNLFRELRTISLLSKTMKKDPTALPAWQTLRLVTKDGAKVLGLGKKIGSLEEGKIADLITIDLEQLSLVPVVDYPFRTFIPNLVYTAFGNEVNNVIINGKIILENNNFTTIDEQSLIKRANVRAQEIFEEAADIWAEANSELVKKTKKGFL